MGLHVWFDGTLHVEFGQGLGSLSGNWWVSAISGLIIMRQGSVLVAVLRLIQAVYLIILNLFKKSESKGMTAKDVFAPHVPLLHIEHSCLA